MISVIDTETTIFKKGNPFARKNQLIYVGTYQPGRTLLALPAAEFLLQKPGLDASQFLVFFNAKFDLHWLRREYGWAPNKEQRVWCCQLAHFMLTSQQSPYPSLEEVANHFGIKRGADKGSTAYWARGVDTPDIPPETVLEDLKNDLLVTYEIYLRQVEAFRKLPKLFNLFRLGCDDLLVLAEMEWNGLFFNAEESKRRAEQIRVEISGIEEQLKGGWPTVPINFDSPAHISALLYGGIIVEDQKIVVGNFQTGARAGQERFKHKKVEHVLPQLCEPIEGSSLQKEGVYSTDESVIRQLTGAKAIRELLLRRSKLSKELDYLQGLPELINEMDWDANTLHSSFNQCVAATGRLSSSKPNSQNLTDGVLSLVESTYV